MLLFIHQGTKSKQDVRCKVPEHTEALSPDMAGSRNWALRIKTQPLPFIPQI